MPEGHKALRFPRFVHAGTPLTKKERLAEKFRQWNSAGRTTSPTAEVLAGMFYSRYRFKMGGLLPMSRVDDDLHHFRTLLSKTKDLAIWVIEAVFYIDGFTNYRADMFTNQRVINSFNLISCATKLRHRSVAGEQSEFFTDQKSYGVIRV